MTDAGTGRWRRMADGTLKNNEGGVIHGSQSEAIVVVRGGRSLFLRFVTTIILRFENGKRTQHEDPSTSRVILRVLSLKHPIKTSVSKTLIFGFLLINFWEF